MDEDGKDLVNRLFALATMILEDATQLAVNGQSVRLHPLQLTKLAEALKEAANDVAKIADAAALAIRSVND